MRVVRFPVAQSRRLKTFADLSDEVFDGRASLERQTEWFRENGPVVPRLLDHLRTSGSDYDLVLFWTFRYFPSFFGVPLVDERAVLVPTAEDDAAIHLPILEDFFQRPAGYLFLTPEEETLVSARAGQPLRPSATIGIGLEPAGGRPTRATLDALGIPRRLPALSRTRRSQQGLPHAARVLPGLCGRRTTGRCSCWQDRRSFKMPAHPRIRALGYVADEVRSALLTHARALVVPSPLRVAVNRAARSLEPRRAGARERALPRARGTGHARQRRPVLSFVRRVRRSALPSPHATTTSDRRSDVRASLTWSASTAGRRCWSVWKVCWRRPEPSGNIVNSES